MKKQNVAVLFGGVSAEHEVSIITGLQVVENIDRQKYEVFPILLDKKGDFYFYPQLTKKQDFLKTKKIPCDLIREGEKTFLQKRGLGAGKINLEVAYLAFHGGNGENGDMQGFLEVINLPFTSCSCESSVLTMNKVLSKRLVEKEGIPLIGDVNFFAEEVKENLDQVAEKVEKELDYPVIVKPAHLGSSIGIEIAKNKGELKKSLSVSALIDSEVLVEKFLEKIKEYNVSIFKDEKDFVFSEIEKPLAKDEILSFKDKYAEGGKKTQGGMASLSRELPAKLEKKETELLKGYARKIYQILRCNGLVRVDFIRDQQGNFYFCEVNTIPGSMAFYLWEASGMSFQEQITRSLEEAIKRQQDKKAMQLDYETDIVEKFVKG